MAAASGCRMTGVAVTEVGVEVARRLAEGSGLGDRIAFVQADGTAALRAG